MVGARGGVAKLLKDCVSSLVSHHCIEHCLALVCGQSAAEVSKCFKSVLEDYSGKRCKVAFS